MSTPEKARDAWFMQTERQERELAAKAQTAKFARRQRESIARFRGASEWVAGHMPDLVDEDGEVCPFAAHAAIDLKNTLQRHPTTDEVRAYRRLGWAHIREEEEGHA